MKSQTLNSTKRLKSMLIVFFVILHSSYLNAQDITLIDHISGSNDPSKLTTLLDWSNVSSSSFKLKSINKITNAVNTSQTIAQGGFQYNTGLNPVMPSGATTITATGAQYSTGTLSGFGTQAWETTLPGSTAYDYSYTTKLTAVSAGVCQFSIADFDGDEHYQVYGTLQGGGHIVPSYLLRVQSGSNITATSISNAYLNLKSTGNVSVSDYDIVGSVDVYFITPVDAVFFTIVNDKASPAGGRTVEITNLMGVNVTATKETRLTVAANSGTNAQKTYFNKIYTSQLGVAASDYDGPDYANVVTFDNIHYAESPLKRTMMGTNVVNGFSQDTHIQGNADIYVNIIPDAAYDLIPQSQNIWGHDYPFYPNNIPHNMGLEVSLDYAGRNYINENYELNKPIGAYGVWMYDNHHDNSPEIHTVEQIWDRYDDANGKTLYRLGHVSDGSNRFDSISNPSYTTGFWAVKPSVDVFAIAFKVLPNAAEETYTITKTLEKKINPLTGDPNVNRLFVNNMPLITVSELGGNYANIGFENVYWDTDGYIKGFITIKTSINQATNKGDAYLYMDVNKGGFTYGSPAIPTNFSVSQITDHTVRFNWSGADGTTTYLVQERPVGASDWGYQETRANKNNFKYSMGYSAGTQHEWRIIAYKGASKYISPTIGTFTTGTTAKAIPKTASLSVNGVTANSMVLNWQVVSGAVGYDIEYGRQQDPWILANQNGIIQSTNFTLANLLPGSGYTWRVYARYADSGYSEYARAGYTNTSGSPLVTNNIKGQQNAIHEPMDPANSPEYKKINSKVNPANLQIINDDKRGVRISPNPVKDEMEISISKDVNFLSLVLTVYDAKGRAMLEKKYTGSSRDYEMDCDKLKPGSYFLKALMDNKSIMLGKFIKVN